MAEAVTVHAYKASGSEREYTFLFDSDPGQEAVEELLRSFEGDIWITDRFPFMMGNMYTLLKGEKPFNVYDFDLTLVGGGVISAGTQVMFKTYTDILWEPVEDGNEEGFQA